MCIALSRLKMKNDLVRIAILAMDEDHLTLDKIQKLMPIVPKPEEQEQYKNFTGDPADLDVADKFCYALKDIDNLEERLKFWEFKITFESSLNWEVKKIKLYKKKKLFHIFHG
eukprot:184853_1